MNDKIKFNAFILMIFLVFPFICFAQKENKEKSLTLSIKLQDQYNSDFSLCTAITLDEPIEFSWIRDGIKNTIMTSVPPPENGVYRLKFEFKEGTEKGTHYQSRKVFSLKLGKPKDYTDIASLLSNDIYDWKIILSKKTCK